ncbi:MAG: hypothetical protein JNL83_04890 [Myxococcales bacterium]|nr:hypothetical protein [Myxococcales bacterium]
MSPYAFLTGAILVLLAAPLIWMACRVAYDHAIAGVAFVAGLAGLMVALSEHHGSRLVDITFGVVGVGAAILAAATVIGRVTRRGKEARRPSELPQARLHRSGRARTVA